MLLHINPSPGFMTNIKLISAILDSENTTNRDGILEDLTLNDMVYFKYILLLWTSNKVFLHIKTFYLTAVAASCLKT